MTGRRAVEIMENEIACIRRASNGCDRKCEVCDLLMDTGEPLLAYAEAINSKVDRLRNRLRRAVSMKKECDTCKYDGNYLSEEPCNKCYANKHWEPRLKNVEIKLKPCPFCGGEVKLIDTGDYAGFCISCEECDSLFTIERIGATEDDLIKIWERRAVSE